MTEVQIQDIQIGIEELHHTCPIMLMVFVTMATASPQQIYHLGQQDKNYMFAFL